MKFYHFPYTVDLAALSIVRVGTLLQQVTTISLCGSLWLDLSLSGSAILLQIVANCRKTLNYGTFCRTKMISLGPHPTAGPTDPTKPTNPPQPQGGRISNPPTGLCLAVNSQVSVLFLNSSLVLVLSHEHHIFSSSWCSAAGSGKIIIASIQRNDLKSSCSRMQP